MHLALAGDGFEDLRLVRVGPHLEAGERGAVVPVAAERVEVLVVDPAKMVDPQTPNRTSLPSIAPSALVADACSAQVIAAMPAAHREAMNPSTAYPCR